MTTKPSMQRPVAIPTQGATPFERQVIEKLQTLQEGQEGLADIVLKFGDRLGKVEAQIDEHEGRLIRNSSGVERTSSNDSRQDAAIAIIANKVDGLTQSQARQTEMLGTLTAKASALFENKLVQAFFAALLMFLTAWLARHT